MSFRGYRICWSILFVIVLQSRHFIPINQRDSILQRVIKSLMFSNHKWVFWASLERRSSQFLNRIRLVHRYALSAQIEGSDWRNWVVFSSHDKMFGIYGAVIWHSMILHVEDIQTCRLFHVKFVSVSQRKPTFTIWNELSIDRASWHETTAQRTPDLFLWAAWLDFLEIPTNRSFTVRGHEVSFLGRNFLSEELLSFVGRIAGYWPSSAKVVGHLCGARHVRSIVWDVKATISIGRPLAHLHQIQLKFALSSRVGNHLLILVRVSTLSVKLRFCLLLENHIGRVVRNGVSICKLIRKIFSLASI